MSIFILYSICATYCTLSDIAAAMEKMNLRKTKNKGDNRSYPALVEYKALNVKKELVGNIDVKNPFFDTFRPAYKTSFENLHFKSERDFDFLFMHGHDFSIIPSWKNVILSRRAPPKQVILQI